MCHNIRGESADGTSAILRENRERDCYRIVGRVCRARGIFGHLTDFFVSHNVIEGFLSVTPCWKGWPIFLLTLPIGAIKIVNGMCSWGPMAYGPAVFPYRSVRSSRWVPSLGIMSTQENSSVSRATDVTCKSWVQFPPFQKTMKKGLKNLLHPPVKWPARCEECHKTCSLDRPRWVQDVMAGL